MGALRTWSEVSNGDWRIDEIDLIDTLDEVPLSKDANRRKEVAASARAKLSAEELEALKIEMSK